MNYVYILKCKDDTLYTGWTNDLDNRIKMHKEGKGAKYTRGRGPLELMYYEEFLDKKEAMKKEYKIKRMDRSDKIKLIENANLNKALEK
ncbi:MAG: GIY-YIG nuclease family protein [Clostridium sp.]|uniref:GIY-YIG nuclease family protein n=1 Tax=Clostridium sp. TaxID=1506 RepID=UPI003F35FE1F